MVSGGKKKRTLTKGQVLICTDLLHFWASFSILEERKKPAT
jgi:hypothetical protein